MSTNSTSDSINAIIGEKRDILSLIDKPDLDKILREMNYDWAQNLIRGESEALAVFSSNGLTEESDGELRLTRAGLLFYSRLTLPFDFDSIGQPGGPMVGNFVLGQRVSTGKNSVLFLAKHRYLNTESILKFLRPGASQDIVASLQKLGEAGSLSTIVSPTDFFRTRVSDAFGNLVEVDCLVFPVVSGITLNEFLKKPNNFLNSHLVMSFIHQIGEALERLEAIGAYHGDLHDKNIIVDQYYNRGIRFRLIDISYDSMGSMSLDICRNNDLSNFKQHIWRILSAQKSDLPNMSLRKYLGTDSFRKIDKILSPETNSFSEIMRIYRDDRSYLNFADRKKEFVTSKFTPPSTFRLQRYEEIIDPSVATTLFVPFPELISKVSEFGNVFVSGNRGSGKSTYLATLAFFPHNPNPLCNPEEIFGIYFPCRQGEFKSLNTMDERTSFAKGEKTRNILIIKVIRRTMEAICGGIASGRFRSPADSSRLVDFINQFLPAPGIILLDSHIVADFENYLSSLVRHELNTVSQFHLADSSNPAGRFVEPRDLITFFEIIRELFPDLGESRFHILFDDAGEPYTPSNVQRAINDLILTSNPLYCVKFTAEKFTYDFSNSEGKILENGHDYFECDISYMLFIGAKSEGINSSYLERYFREIVENRLRHFRYMSTDIVAYIGDNPQIAELLKGLLATGARNAYYGGWTAVWNIADRTPRNLLELVSEIFSLGHIDPSTAPKVVPIRTQDRAIRTISEKRLQSLSQISGVVSVGGQASSLGRRLFEITASIGSTFHIYLKDQKQNRKQHLAIERNDLGELREEADLLLKRLISFGVLDDSKVQFSRDDRIKKPIYIMNRIYCPAFNISFVRDSHLRLSRGKLELLLLSPETFLKSGTRRLSQNDAGTPDLFGYEIYE